MKAILKYPGSKWRIASWIVSHFPEHHTYVEPYFGSGAVFFNKERSCIETINDLDNDVINFFQWVKNDPEKLAHEIYFTPYARKVYETAFYAIPENSLQQAVNFCIKVNMSHGFRNNGYRVGWKSDVQGRERAYAAADWSNLPQMLLQITERLRGVQIESQPALKLISRYNYENVLLYCDPPYMLSTRRTTQYRHEMTDDDHMELLDALRLHKGPVIISGYESPLYEEKLKDWDHAEIGSHTQYAGTKKKEIIWCNRAINAEKQLSLF